MLINKQPVGMQVDTGAAVSIMSIVTYKQLFSQENSPPIEPTNMRLSTYSGDMLETMGTVTCEVEYHNQKCQLPLVILKQPGPTLLGRNWLFKIRLDWPELTKQVLSLQDKTLNSILEHFQDVFQDELGTFQGPKVKLIVDPQIPPKFYKSRSLPYAMRDKVEEKLKVLQAAGIIELIESSEWAAPIVPVLKRDKQTIRLCGDYQLTVNRVVKLDQYPIPKIEDLLTKIAGGKYFTSLDMSQAYQQLPLHEASKKLVTINTHKGLFIYNRLPFGVSSAPGIFQRTMENLLQGIPLVLIYLDDILVAGETPEEHCHTLSEVLSRLSKAGLRLHKDKCTFMTTSVQYLGYKIDAQGIHPTQAKVKAIKEACTPRIVTELKAYLGILTYYSKFLPNLSTMLAPLYALFQKDQAWLWQAAQAEAFQKSKDMLTSSSVLTHYNPDLELTLACDASQYGLGAVLSHHFPSGEEKPIAFASRTLSKAKQNYSQIEKENLALVFGVQRFHSYLYGWQFTLYTDHKPLESLLNPWKSISKVVSQRIQHWALTLTMYEYTVNH